MTAVSGVGSFSDLDLHSTTRGQALGGAWAVAGKADQEAAAFVMAKSCIEFNGTPFVRKK